MGAERLKLPLRGITSAARVSEIERVMRQQEGVIWATVNFAADEVNIVYDAGRFDLVELVKAVDEQGCAVVVGASEITSLGLTIPTRERRLQRKFLWRAWR